MELFLYCRAVTIIFFFLLPCDTYNIPNSHPVTPEQWSAEFLARPKSRPLHIFRQSNIKISNLSFSNINGIAIIVEGCENVQITENDFANLVGGILVLDSKNVTITWNRFSNIGDGTTGSGHSNYIQLNKTFGGYIAHNKGKGGNTEDMISLYQSGGIAESEPLIIEYNHLEGENWISKSGSGIMLGDSGGYHIVARYNTLLSPGQVGIGIACGIDIHIINNIVYGGKIQNSNVGIYVWNQCDMPLNNVEISSNDVRWYKEDGTENPYWNGEIALTPKGEESNNWHANIDAEKLKVKL